MIFLVLNSLYNTATITWNIKKNPQNHSHHFNNSNQLVGMFSFFSNAKIQDLFKWLYWRCMNHFCDELTLIIQFEEWKEITVIQNHNLNNKLISEMPAALGYYCFISLQLGKEGVVVHLQGNLVQELKTGSWWQGLKPRPWGDLCFLACAWKNA